MWIEYISILNNIFVVKDSKNKTKWLFNDLWSIVKLGLELRLRLGLFIYLTNSEQLSNDKI